MSQYSEIMDALAAQDEKLDWCVAALKYLLGREAGWQAETTLDELELDLEDDDLGDVVVPVHAPRQPKAKPCPHNQQGVVNGRLTCLRCGFIWSDSGLVQNRVAPDGSVIYDPNPPQWATEHSPGASSKNPGIPLVPHSS